MMDKPKDFATQAQIDHSYHSNTLGHLFLISWFRNPRWEEKVQKNMGIDTLYIIPSPTGWDLSLCQKGITSKSRGEDYTYSRCW